MVEEVAGPRDICQAVLTAIFPSGVLQQLFESSSTTTGHYVLNKDADPKRLGSENNAMKEAQQAHVIRLSLGRRLVNLLPVRSPTD